MLGNRKKIALGTAVFAVAGAVYAATAMVEPAAAARTVTVWKSPTCGCCTDWVDHMRQAGFDVAVRNVDDMQPLKTARGVPPQMQSCHTAEVDGYVLEGHVPADAVNRMLAERPQAKGLAVPGMPQGSPGMETGQKDPYEVVLFGTPQGSKVYERR